MPPEVPALQSEFVLLEGGFVDAHAKNENIVLNYVRWLCLLAAMSSLCFLVISSFFATGRIVLGFQICAVVAYAPFAWGLVMVMALSIHVRLGANQMAKHQARLIEEETKYYRMEKQSTETKSGGTSDGH